MSKRRISALIFILKTLKKSSLIRINIVIIIVIVIIEERYCYHYFFKLQDAEWQTK